MKLKNVKVGQILIDKFGNEYRVLFVANDYDMPVELECVKFSQCVNVDGNFTFTRIGQCFWIFKSKKRAKCHGTRPFIDHHFITLKSLKLKD